VDIQSRKLSLIQWLAGLTDEHLLKKVEAISKEDVDFWDELTEQQQLEIKQGINELDAGKKHVYRYGRTGIKN
jgi:hypothetical protein